MSIGNIRLFAFMLAIMWEMRYFRIGGLCLQDMPSGPHGTYLTNDFLSTHAKIRAQHRLVRTTWVPLCSLLPQG